MQPAPHDTLLRACSDPGVPRAARVEAVRFALRVTREAYVLAVQQASQGLAPEVRADLARLLAFGLDGHGVRDPLALARERLGLAPEAAEQDWAGADSAWA